VKPTSVVATVVGAVVLQVTLARYTVGGDWVFDLVLVGVLFAGLQWGPAAGIMGGTIGGLLQDVLSGEIAGVGGLAKTIAGFGAGMIGTRFVLARPHARSIIVAVGTLVHRFTMLGLTALVEQHWPGLSWGAMLAETGINTLVAFLVFQVAAAVPGAVERRRASGRTSLSRRQW
jgi:rod shape-determining protein MreD